MHHKDAKKLFEQARLGYTNNLTLETQYQMFKARFLHEQQVGKDMQEIEKEKIHNDFRTNL